MELALLRRMPLILILTTALPLGVSALARIWFSGGQGFEVAKRIASVDIFVIATIVTGWTAVLTVSIACFIIFVMKGPAYVADAYPLNEASRPAPDIEP